MSRSAMSRLLGCSVLMLPLAGLLWIGQADAAPTLAGLTAEIERSERDLRILQQDYLQLAQSNYGGADVNAMERRFAAIEQELRRLTGQIERLGFEQRQLADRYERMQSDVDFRLTRLEGGNPAPASGGASGSFSGSSGSGGTGGSFSSSSASQQGGGGTQTLGNVSAQELQQLQGLGQGQTASVGQSGSGNFSGQSQNAPSGSLSTGSLGTASTYGSQQGTFTEPSTTNLPSGSPEAQYKYAYGLLRKADYQGAEQALKAFVQSNPSDPLVANAKYWLGETYYVRGNYTDASQAFAQAYQDHSSGPKAADSLLKLGFSLSLLDRTNEACQVLGVLQTRMGNSAKTNILARGRREQAKLGC